jgi:hypothetical protein
MAERERWLYNAKTGMLSIGSGQCAWVVMIIAGAVVIGESAALGLQGGSSGKELEVLAPKERAAW